MASLGLLRSDAKLVNMTTQHGEVLTLKQFASLQR